MINPKHEIQNNMLNIKKTKNFTIKSKIPI